MGQAASLSTSFGPFLFGEFIITNPKTWIQRKEKHPCQSQCAKYLAQILCHHPSKRKRYFYISLPKICVFLTLHRSCIIKKSTAAYKLQYSFYRPHIGTKRRFILYIIEVLGANIPEDRESVCPRDNAAALRWMRPAE